MYEHLNRLRVVGTKLSEFTLFQLSTLTRMSARALVPQITHENALGYDAGGNLGFAEATWKKKSPLLYTALCAKQAHTDKVILMRVGEFYEAFGVDALFLVQYAALNPMGARARAGCPFRNIQNTLDSLTSQGLSAVIFEESAATDHSNELTSNNRQKNRFQSGIVSPATPLYFYDGVLSDTDSSNSSLEEGYRKIIAFRVCKSFAVDYLEMCPASRSVHLIDRLPIHAARSMLLHSSPIAKPLLIFGTKSDRDFIRKEFRSILNPSDIILFDTQKPFTFQSIPQFIEQAVRYVSDDLGLEDPQSFFVQVTTGIQSELRPRPVYLSTAQQVGLIRAPHIPFLLDYLVPESVQSINNNQAPFTAENMSPKTESACAKRFFARWLLCPPPYTIADRMQNLLRQLNLLQVALPSSLQRSGYVFPLLNVERIVTAIYRRSASVGILRDVYSVVNAVEFVLRSDEYESITADLITIGSYLCGEHVELEDILARARQLRKDLESTICVELATAELDLPSGFSPSASPSFDQYRELNKFFEDNEHSFRGKLNLDKVPEMAQVVQNVDCCANELQNCIQSDFALHSQQSGELEYRSLDSAVVLKLSAKDKKSVALSDDCFQWRDRKGKQHLCLFSSRKVTHATDNYLSSVRNANETAKRVLEVLNSRLCQHHIHLLRVVAVLSELIHATCAHVESARQRGWALPELDRIKLSEEDKQVREKSEDHQARQVEMSLDGVFPFWLSRHSCISNDVWMKGMAILTAANMAGKSTIMRSIAVAAMLANAGLFVPCNGGSRVGRYDCIYVKSASSDAPSEGLSAFAFEMDELAIVFRDCGARSLVLLDEVGRGTSSRDGSALSGAILEALYERKINGVFATHLHEIFSLPLHVSMPTDIDQWTIPVHLETDNSTMFSTFKIEKGFCTDSLAMHTAKFRGIPHEIVERASELANTFDQISAHCGNLHKTTAAVSSASAELNGIALESGLQIISKELQDLLKCTRAILVHDGYDIPPSMHAMSCLYILNITRADGEELFYVGETDSIARRLDAHRKSISKKVSRNAPGSDSSSSARVRIKSVCLFSAQNKSQARLFESMSIKYLRERGYPLLSQADASHNQFGQARISK